MPRGKPKRIAWESWIDLQIRQSQERGEFDNLTGAGQPLADVDRPHDKNWWIRRKLADEDASFLPPALAIAKDRDDVLECILHEPAETTARTMLIKLNERIRQANRLTVSGPPSSTMPVDIERALVKRRTWRSSTHSATD
jgi:Domain of unknown function (DUF1992)